MRHQVAQTRDTLQTTRVPVTDHMQLNYRPALAPALRVTGAAAVMTVGLVLLITIVYALVEWFGPFVGFAINFSTLLFVALWIALQRSYQQGTPPWSLSRALRYLAAVGLVAGLWSLAAARHRGATYAALVIPLFALLVVLAYLILKQLAYWTCVNPRVGWQQSREWRLAWQTMTVWQVSPLCPEMLTFRVAAGLLLFQGWIGVEVSRWAAAPERGSEFNSAAAWVALVSMLGPLPIYWFVWQQLGVVPRLSFGTTVQGTLKAWQVWLAYMPASPHAPGVFQFPDRWLRLGWIREGLACLAVALVAMALLALQPPVPGNAVLASVRQMNWLLFGTGLTADASALELTLAALAVICTPVLATLVILWFLMGSVAGRYWLALESPQGYAQSEKSPWAIAVDRILNSQDSLEREHLLLGRSLFGDYPVLLHKSLLQQHAHLVGDTGSRKTSLGIAPLIAQLIAARDCSVLVLDLKGDRALFETSRLEAGAAGAEFRWFSLEAGTSSHVFNPLAQTHFQALSAHQRTQQVMEGLALNYGDAYGKGFFSAMNEVVLLHLCREFELDSFRELHELLRDPQASARLGNREDWKKAQHLSALVDRLASISPLNLTPADLRERPSVQAATIEAGDLMSRPQVAYFNLRSALDPVAAPSVGKLALYSLFAAAARRQGDQSLPVYVVVDEFQQMVSENIRLVLEQARSSQLHFIVAHQHLDQLDRKGIDVRDTVTSCTAFKQFFRASDPRTIRWLEELSGQACYENLAWRQDFLAGTDPQDESRWSPQFAQEQTVTVQETIGYRLDRNLIMDISATPNTSFVQFTEGSGFTQFGGYVTPMISDYHISEREYERRGAASWPAADDTTVLVSEYFPTSHQSPLVTAPIDEERQPTTTTNQDLQARLAALAGNSSALPPTSNP